ncbi:MAG: transporter substrate-binding domain-containing protein [Acidaminococcaceae bacterium]
MQIKKIIAVLGVGLLAAGVLAGCGSDAEKTGEKTDVKKVKVAYAQNSKPMTYSDENGKPAGHDVEVMKLVDGLLPQYEFEFIPTTDDDLLLGVEQGKYDVGIKNTFYTEARAKKYLYPKEFLGLSSFGLVLRTNDANIKTLPDFAKAGKTLAPIAANNAQYTVIAEYNQKNPDNTVKLEAGDAFTVNVIEYVNEGRSDGGAIIEGQYDQKVRNNDGPYHSLNDKLVYNEVDVIKTWPLFNKKQQEFADAYDRAIKQLKAEKKTNELSRQFYGRDLYEVLDKVSR